MFRKYLVSFIILFFCGPLFASAGKGFIVEMQGSTKNMLTRKHMIETSLGASSMDFWYKALTIILNINQVEPRGKMQWKTITLSPHVTQDGEFLKLLVHEIGHYVDIFFLPAGDTKDSDVSNRFYEISWKDVSTKKSGETLSNFISGYAATNRYEDFAESFTFYIFHNTEFADRALRNDSLRQKYLFFAEHVFSDGQCISTDYSVNSVPAYLWDTTKIPIRVKNYLYSLK